MGELIDSARGRLIRIFFAVSAPGNLEFTLSVFSVFQQDPGYYSCFHIDKSEFILFHLPTLLNK